MNRNVYFIWLSLKCGAGSETASYLLSRFGSPEEIYNADKDELKKTEIDHGALSALLDRDLSYSEKIESYCERMNIGIMTIGSPLYPKRLRAIHAKPILLYYKGKIPDIDDNVMIACVGTRTCSHYGAAMAYRLGADIAAGGGIVVSGMASGIDTMAHLGALSAGGHTIAVLGCGIDIVYPPQNKDLMESIIARGTVITEYAPGTKPLGANFPIRNRIISGLCQGTVVVEADMNSGSLITASKALSQGRDIFAVPGRVGEKQSSGTNTLIRDGAKIVTDAYDILSEYEMLYPHRIFTEKLAKRYGGNLYVASGSALAEKIAEQDNAQKIHKEKHKSKKTEDIKEDIKKLPDTSALSEIEREVFDVITKNISADEIKGELTAKKGKNIDTGELLSVLTSLEIEGLIESLPGGFFHRK